MDGGAVLFVVVSVCDRKENLVGHTLTSSAKSAVDRKRTRHNGSLFTSLATPTAIPPHSRINTIADAGTPIYLPPSSLGCVWVHYRPVDPCDQ